MGLKNTKNLKNRIKTRIKNNEPENLVVKYKNIASSSLNDEELCYFINCLCERKYMEIINWVKNVDIREYSFFYSLS